MCGFDLKKPHIVSNFRLVGEGVVEALLLAGGGTMVRTTRILHKYNSILTINIMFLK
jgi:hypothetical protein